MEKCQQDEFARKDYVDVRFEAAESAVERANHELNRRLADANDFKKLLTTQASEFLTEKEYISKHEALILRVVRLEDESKIHQARQAGLSTIWKVAVAIVGFLASFALVLNALGVHL